MTYQLSGRVAPTAALAPLGLLATAAVLGFVYGYGVVWIPIVGIVSIVLLFGFGFLVAAANERLQRETHVRSRPVSVLLGVFGGLASVYFAWVGFAHALLGPEGLPLVQAFNPLFLVRFAFELNAIGWYEVGGSTPSGGVLWGIWAVEAGFLFGFPAYQSLWLPQEPYCEGCGAWTTMVPPPLLLAENAGQDVKGAVERLDLAALTALEGYAGDRIVHVLQPWVCPKCKEFAALSLEHVTIHPPDANGKISRTEKNLVKWRLVTPDDLATLGAVGQAMAEARANSA